MKKTEVLLKKTINCIIPIMFLLLVTVNSCSKSNSDVNPANALNTGGVQPYTINIEKLAYSPASLTVPVNTTVTWINMDTTPHTVSGDNGLFESGSIGASQKFSYTFTNTGTFSYHCSIHLAVKAKIIVQ